MRPSVSDKGHFLLHGTMDSIMPLYSTEVHTCRSWCLWRRGLSGGRRLQYLTTEEDYLMVFRLVLLVTSFIFLASSWRAELGACSSCRELTLGISCEPCAKHHGTAMAIRPTSGSPGQKSDSESAHGKIA